MSEPRDTRGPRRIAYLVSRFPKLTETFVLYEMLEVESQGTSIDLYPLQRERVRTMHAEAEPWMPRAHFTPALSWPIVMANLRTLVRRPRLYVTTLASLLASTWGSLRFWVGGLVFYPKAVYFAERMAADSIEHLHAHFANHPAAMAWVVHRLSGIPYSFTAHGSDLHCDRHMLKEKVQDAAFVIAISEYNRNVILAECGPSVGSKVLVIHCGVDLQAFRPVAAAPSQSQRVPSILSIGTLHEVKGQTYLIEACRLLAAKGLEFTCHFIGDGPDQDSLSRQVARAGLGARVTFHGRKTQEEVRALLSRADLVAVPSVPTSGGRREGIPVVLMEAMSCGIAVVASRLSGIPELVLDDSTGLLVEPRDANGLAEALERLLRDPNLRRRLGDAARAKVEREFDLRKNAAALTRRFLGAEVEA